MSQLIKGPLSAPTVFFQALPIQFASKSAVTLPSSIAWETRLSTIWAGARQQYALQTTVHTSLTPSAPSEHLLGQENVRIDCCEMLRSQGISASKFSRPLHPDCSTCAYVTSLSMPSAYTPSSRRPGRHYVCVYAARRQN